MELPFHNTERLLLHLEIHPSKILTQNTEQHGIDAERSKDEHSDGGEPRWRAKSYGKVSDKISEDGEYCREGHTQPYIGRHSQRHDRLVNDAVQREHDIVVDRELGFPPHPGAAVVVDTELIEAE